MWEIALTVRPCCKLHIWKCMVDDSHCACCPLPLCLGIHFISQHHLDEAMDYQALPIRCAPDQGEGAQRFNRLIELEGVRGNGFEYPTEMPCSLGDDLFGNGIRVEEGTETQQVGGGRV